MKNLILLLCISLFCTISYGQIAAEILDATVFEDLDLETNGDIPVHINLINTSQDTLNVRWEIRRSESMCQEEWGFLICDNNNCYTEFISSNVDPDFPIDIPSVMPPNDNYDFIVHILPKLFEGCCDVTIDFSLVEAIDDIILSIDLPIQINDANCSVTSTKDDLLPNLVMYPNPFNDFVTLQNAEGISRAKIYDIKGQLVSDQKISNNTISNLEEITEGLYLVSFYNENSELLKTVNIIKE